MVAGALAIVLVVLEGLSVALAPALKDRLVRGANERLVGYAVDVGSLSMRFWNLELVFRDVKVRQAAHPAPDVARVPRLDIELQWLSLLRGRLVAVCHFDSPVVNINIAQLEEETRDTVAFRNRGWQRLLELYPLDVNDLQMRNASLTYTAQDAEQPLELREGTLRIRNIQRVDAKDQRYPSPFHATAVVFNSGHAQFDGAADFVRFSSPAFRSTVSIDAVPLAALLDALGPVLKRYPLKIMGGVLEAQGGIQRDPSGTKVTLARGRISGIRVDYLGGSDPAVVEAGRRAVKAAARAASEPGVLLEVDDLRISGEFGYINLARTPNYRLFLSDSELALQHVANHGTQVESTAALKGLMMGSGPTSVHGVFRSGTGKPDFALDIRVIDADLTSLNDMLRAHTRLDVAKGKFSVYSQILVRNGQISGYVKPLFQNVQIFGAQDANENVFHQLYERVADGVRTMLQNHERHEVATVADLSGTLADPNTSTPQVIGMLLRNAFFRAIVPGFDQYFKHPEASATAPKDTGKPRH